MRQFLSTAASDFPASIVVFLVALPLCLGIALGSGAPLMAGLVAGIVGGLVVASISGSRLSVSGPAAGLITIVAAAIITAGSYEAFLVAVVLCGVVQVALGVWKLGGLGDYIPNAVIKGMLAAIGVLLILKQAPHLIGYDANFEGDFAFQEAEGQNTFSALVHATKAVTPAAMVVGFTSLALLWLWERPWIKRWKPLRLVPGPLVAVLVGVGLHELVAIQQPELRLEISHLVQLPLTSGVTDALSLLRFPDLRALAVFSTWKAGVTLAIVASLETLLSVTAVDKLDRLKRISPPNRELVAQGIGNIVSGLLGGLPVTSVIVRSSANVQAGGQSRLSTMLHGLWLLLSVLFLAPVLNHIPLASLAAILIFTGYKLAKVELFVEHFRRGFNQFIPFVVTVLAIVFTDLLTGVLIGLAVGVVFLVRSNFGRPVLVVAEENRYLVRLRRHVSFFSKPKLKEALRDLPNNSQVFLDLQHADFLDSDVLDVIAEFRLAAESRGIELEISPTRADPTQRLALEEKHP